LQAKKLRASGGRTLAETVSGVVLFYSLARYH
jgi:hypothetical protein